MPSLKMWQRCLCSALSRTPVLVTISHIGVPGPCLTQFVANRLPGNSRCWLKNFNPCNPEKSPRRHSWLLAPVGPVLDTAGLWRVNQWSEPFFLLCLSFKNIFNVAEIILFSSLIWLTIQGSITLLKTAKAVTECCIPRDHLILPPM